MNRKEHLLLILSEECAEVMHRASKALRFGLEEVEPEQLHTNAQRIVDECNDVIAVMELCVSENVLPHLYMQEKIAAKKAKVEKFLEYSAQCGTLEDNLSST